MTDLRKVLEITLEAFELYQSKNSVQMFDDAVSALRQALAQPEQEPIGFFSINDYGNWEENENGYGTALYTAPLNRELVGLTDQNIEDVWQSLMARYIEEVDSSYWGRCDFEFARAIEAKLKEKNNG